MDRGKIINRGYATQIRDFSGLRFGNITPTDIDGFIDFQNNRFVIMEFKYEGSNYPFGQKLALERLVDGLHDAGKKCIGIIASHHTNGDIDCSNCKVEEYRYNKRWYIKETLTTVKQLIDKFLTLTGGNFYSDHSGSPSHEGNGTPNKPMTETT